jgi:hypothetical protein
VSREKSIEESERLRFRVVAVSGGPFAFEKALQADARGEEKDGEGRGRHVVIPAPPLPTD